MADTVEITKQMLADLRILHRSKPLGCFQSRKGFRSPAGTVAKADAAMLLGAQLARKDYSRRAPRLLITAAGTRRLAELSPRSI